MAVQEIRTHTGIALAFAVCKDPLDVVPIVEMAWYESKEFAEKLAYDLCGKKEAANPDSYEKKASLIITMEERIIAAEMLGICKWFLLNLTPFLEIPAKLLSLATGVDTNESDLLTSAERIRTLERAVNVIQGVGREDDTLPKRLFKAAVPSGRFKGAKLDQQKFDTMVDEYYALSGFNENGVPKKDIFIKLGLEKEWDVFSKRIHV
jgi:aldehyde:ferredoxin oxidoreductase